MAAQVSPRGSQSSEGRRSSSIFRLFSKSSKKERSQSIAHGDSGSPRRGPGTNSPRRSLQLSGKDSYMIEQRSTNASSLSGRSNLAMVQSPNSYTSRESNGNYSLDKQTGEMKYERDKQTGEIIDHTEMLHSLGLVDSKKERPALYRVRTQEGTEPGSEIVGRLSEQTWEAVRVKLSLADLAALSLSCKAFHERLGDKPWKTLEEEGNENEKVDFLQRLDKMLPDHLLCFDCKVYHKRLAPGDEKLQPVNVQNPVYDCPEVGNPNKINPRIRLTFDRILPLTFLQLAMRAQRFGPVYGITTDSISRKFKDKVDDSTWSHQTKFVVVKGHLLMRVMSSCHAIPGLPPAGERHLIYSRQNFIPFFSVCPHWQDGVLLPNVKCALRHIPKPPEGSGINRVAQEVKLHYNPHNPIISLCSECRPMRRCPECPSEYLIEIRMTEDRSDPSKLFKQTLVVTRYSDLGDGTSPYTPEWQALNGKPGYESFKELGKRAVAGQFEAECNGDVIPAQNMLSMNPDKMKLGERGHDWY